MKVVARMKKKSSKITEPVRGDFIVSRNQKVLLNKLKSVQDVIVYSGISDYHGLSY